MVKSMYPLKFKPIYKEKIWGGNNLSGEFNRELPSDLIGESWELAAHQKGVSKVANGPWAGKSIIEVIDAEGAKILGNQAAKDCYDKFPLLIKFLDANDKLSVQVHPDEKYALKEKIGDLGKTEVWYIIAAQKGAKLIFGIKDGVTKAEFKKAIKEKSLRDKLVEVEVGPGDAFYIPAGTVHAIQEGIVLAEIQQNSDATYRVYDWNRVGQDGKSRQLHIKQALEVIDFGAKNTKITPLQLEAKSYLREILAASNEFIVESIELKNSFKAQLSGERFEIFQVIKGETSLVYQQGELKLKAGETILLPAQLGEYQLKGEAKLLRSYIQNLVDFKAELKARGCSKEDISKIAGIN